MGTNDPENDPKILRKRIAKLESDLASAQRLIDILKTLPGHSKRGRRKRRQRRAEERRIHTQVHGRDVLWSLDATHLGSEKRGVVHLLSLPHTPRHNPWVERGHRDLEDESGLGKGVLIVDRRDAAQRLLAAIDRIDGHRRRATLGFRKARAIDAEMHVPYDDSDRARLRDEVRRRRDEALQRPVSARARRVLCREAVLAVLEENGWITRTRGGRSDAVVKHEGVS